MIDRPPVVGSMTYKVELISMTTMPLIYDREEQMCLTSHVSKRPYGLTVREIGTMVREGAA